MRALELDYRRQGSWLQAAGWAGLLLACLVTGYQGWHYRQLAVAVDARQVAIAAQVDLQRLHRPAPKGAAVLLQLLRERLHTIIRN